MADVLAARDEYRAQSWAMVIQECNSSGLSNREFCRQRGIAEKSFYYWQRKLRQQIVESISPQLVQVEPASVPVPDDVLQIQYRGAELKLPAGVDMDAVATLFSLEKKCANLKDKYRKEYRQNIMLPVLEEYFCWVNTLDPEEGSKLADAVTYARHQKDALCAFTEHGDVPISNNWAENAIRPFAVGRKNWLFCDTVNGAESSAIVYSMVETAKANGIDPYEYLFYVLSVLPYYGKSVSHERLEAMMPWSKRGAAAIWRGSTVRN